MQKIDATAPHEIMLVVDAGTGQNAINQVQVCITRLTFLSSSIKLLLLCKRPAVSAINTSIPLARALSKKLCWW
jgi:hypothetical protein